MAISITGSGLSGCANMLGCIEGSNELTSEVRIPASENPDTRFTGVQLEGSVDVMLSEGPWSVRVEGDDNLLKLVTTTVADGKLVIDNDGCYTSQNRLVVHVSLPDLASIGLNGSGDISGASRLTPSALAITSSGSGDLSLDIETADLQIVSNGSGDITLRGRAVTSTTQSNGSGDLAALELQTDRTIYTSMGSGDGEVLVSRELHAQLSGSGDLGYRGTPEIYDVNESGSGDIRRIP